MRTALTIPIRPVEGDVAHYFHANVAERLAPGITLPLLGLGVLSPQAMMLWSSPVVQSGRPRQTSAETVWLKDFQR